MSKNETPLDPGAASTTQQAPVIDNDAAPPKVEGVTPGDTPSPVLKTEEPKSKEKTTKVRLKFDYWPEEGVREPAGKVVALPLSKAKELVSQGKAERPLEDD
ncbi:hypothetical protein [Rhizobium sp. X9]|uniref:hypothetical protein n=1 Tax=Rhizobium sp. X9 TaxID=2815360 RepID=UPI001C0B6F52|nr:hypothetical protein [Rhizobium sp. X9]